MSNFLPLRAALLAKVPQLQEEYISWVRRSYARIAEANGGVVQESVPAWSSNYFVINYLLRPVCDAVGGGIALRLDRKLVINEVDLAKVAAKWAEAAALEWYGKIVSKLGEVESIVEHAAPSRSDLRLSGVKAGREFRLEQQRIMKSSPKGRVFNQFPARLYVDGKFVSEAAFKKMFA